MEVVSYCGVVGLIYCVFSCCCCFVCVCVKVQTISFEMSDFNNRSQNSARRGDYVWQYEYYDDEEPVSFEGLKAHRCKLKMTAYI